ncbi:methyltransferase domain-containing protein [Mangrovicella endophytica]|uniref:methyltransferase domain-containing protein n=1 Tax=Mangrovicella endophytica TaxID=2066697 RepID=UPI000C9E52AA|nr:methyltransferase domain-containing protein [Mangrovicella endophytica]
MIIDTYSSGDATADRRAEYAADYAAGGDAAAAAELMEQALQRAPGWAAGWMRLADYRDAAGDRDGAASACRQALELDPADGQGAGLRLAAYGLVPPPDTAPPAFVRGLFDQYADRFETALVEKLDYAAPAELEAALIAAAGLGRRFRAALDLGCGTGLMGERLHSLVDRLVGVDLSPGMLEKARRKSIYDDLTEGDILGFVAEPCTFDLVTAADVLNYLGDLTPVFARVATWLAPGGLFAFTVEAQGGPEPFMLRETMRYAHDGAAVLGLLEEAGFKVMDQRSIVLRTDRGAPVAGIVFVAAR